MSSHGSGNDRSLSAVEEIRLISEAKHGDPRSFETLVERYMGRAVHVAMGYVGNRDDALDMAQEAFYRVYRTLERFRDGEPFAPWFFRILRNACLTFLSRRKRRRAFSISRRHDDEGDFELPDHAQLAPVDRAELNEGQRQFWKCLETLPMKHREIILLRHLEDLEYAAIAEVLGIPIGTVMSRLFHARRKLRGAMIPYMEGKL